jgi:hypothetical protein
VLVALFAPLAWAAVREAPPAEPELARRRQRHALPRRAAHPAFWVFGLASAMFGLVYSGIALFNQSILEQRGFDANVYQMVLVVSTLLGLLANFGGGWLAMRWPIQRLMGLGMGQAGVHAGGAARGDHANRGHRLRRGDGWPGGVADGSLLLRLEFRLWPGRTRPDPGRGADDDRYRLRPWDPFCSPRPSDRTGSYDGMFRVLAGLTAALGLACWRVQDAGMNKLLGVLLILTSCGASRVATPRRRVGCPTRRPCSTGRRSWATPPPGKSRASRPKSATPSTA